MGANLQLVAKLRPLAGGVHANVPPAGHEAPAGGGAAAASPAAAATARTPLCESATAKACHSTRRPHRPSRSLLDTPL